MALETKWFLMVSHINYFAVNVSLLLPLFLSDPMSIVLSNGHVFIYCILLIGIGVKSFFFWLILSVKENLPNNSAPNSLSLPAFMDKYIYITYK